MKRYEVKETANGFTVGYSRGWVCITECGSHAAAVSLAERLNTVEAERLENAVTHNLGGLGINGKRSNSD